MIAQGKVFCNSEPYCIVNGAESLQFNVKVLGLLFENMISCLNHCKKEAVHFCVVHLNPLCEECTCVGKNGCRLVIVENRRAIREAILEYIPTVDTSDLSEYFHNAIANAESYISGRVVGLLLRIREAKELLAAGGSLQGKEKTCLYCAKTSTEEFEGTNVDVLVVRGWVCEDCHSKARKEWVQYYEQH